MWLERVFAMGLQCGWNVFCNGFLQCGWNVFLQWVFAMWLECVFAMGLQ